jgi:hypothetical protein
MCFTLNQFTTEIWYILRSGWRKWSDVELFESLNRKYLVKSWWNLEYFSVENILPKEFDKLTNVQYVSNYPRMPRGASNFYLV